MRYLIDTNVLLYIILERESMSREVSGIVEDCENAIFVSSESVKEIIHLLHCKKISTKKWKLVQDVFHTVEQELGYTIRYVNREHLLTMARLEPAPNHNDPSDHLIIAQAITEKIPLISSDRKFGYYRKQNLNFIFNER